MPDNTSPMTFDPSVAHAWLRQPSNTHTGLTRAETLGVDEELTGRDQESFLATIGCVPAAEPDGLHPSGEINRLELCLIPDGDVLHQGALITVDLTNGLRLATPHQDIKDFADRDQRGIPAVLSALAHIANQVSTLVAAYHTANPTSSNEDHRSGRTAAATGSAVASATATFTRLQVLDALNKAADDILNAVNAGDEGLRDGINLMVNASIGYLCREVHDLEAVSGVQLQPGLPDRARLGRAGRPMSW